MDIFLTPYCSSALTVCPINYKKSLKLKECLNLTYCIEGGIGASGCASAASSTGKSHGAPKPTALLLLLLRYRPTAMR